jgi:hypothetical protein
MIFPVRAARACLRVAISESMSLSRSFVLMRNSVTHWLVRGAYKHTEHAQDGSHETGTLRVVCVMKRNRTIPASAAGSAVMMMNGSSHD